MADSTIKRGRMRKPAKPAKPRKRPIDRVARRKAFIRTERRASAQMSMRWLGQ
jgi:hypothetical protein